MDEMFVCGRPEVCEKITEKRRHKMEKDNSSPYVFNKFREGLEVGLADVAYDDHVFEREVWRCFSDSQVFEAIEMGELIEHTYDSSKGEYQFLILYYVKTGPKNYRPMHVRGTIHKNNLMMLTCRTVYDPRSHANKWDNNYSRRICVCKVDDRHS